MGADILAGLKARLAWLERATAAVAELEAVMSAALDAADRETAAAEVRRVLGDQNPRQPRRAHPPQRKPPTRGTRGATLLACLADGPVRFTELMRLGGWDSNKMSPVLGPLIPGFVRKVSRGVYELTDAGRAAVEGYRADALVLPLAAPG